MTTPVIPTTTTTVNEARTSNVGADFLGAGGADASVEMGSVDAAGAPEELP